MPYTYEGYKYLPTKSRSGQSHDFDVQYRKNRLAEEKSIRRKKEQIAKKMQH